MMEEIKVLLIDDSSIVHVLLEKVFAGRTDMRICGNAYNGREGLELVRKTNPDVIIMDIGMPEMNGLDAIVEIMDERPTPIIVFAGASKSSIDISFRAIELGAVHIIEKPYAEDLSSLKVFMDEKLVKSIKTFADIKVVRHIKRSEPRTERKTALNHESKDRKQDRPFDEVPAKAKTSTESAKAAGVKAGDWLVIGIAASTGGPQTIRTLLRELGSVGSLAAVVIVQHMAEGFMEGFCEWLRTGAAFPITIPRNGEQAVPGSVYVAPGGYHLAFDADGSFKYVDLPPIMGIRPSADIMFESLAKTFGARAVGVILTGMGSDGVAGLRKVKESGGYVISQDRESSLVFGMPKAAIEAGVVDTVLDLKAIPEHLLRTCKERTNLP
jgi:two-component system, chemotaxis family, protein-glutamate methylesterase/glutaminase